MTCIIALEDPEHGCVWIGGDSSAVDQSHDTCLLAWPKVFVRGPLVLGGSGGIRPLNVLEFAPGLVPPPRAGATDDEWICVDFIEAARQAFREAGTVEVKDGHEAMGDGFAFLVGYHGHAYVVEPDFGVFRSTRGYEVIGCGAPYARGSLYMTEGTYAEARLRVALETAESFNAGVKGPFTVVRGGLTDGRG